MERSEGGSCRGSEALVGTVGMVGLGGEAAASTEAAHLNRGQAQTAEPHFHRLGAPAPVFPQQTLAYPDVYMFGQLDSLIPARTAVHSRQVGGASGGRVAVATAQVVQHGRGGRGGTSSYAARHQAAEQRRRARIAERLERLRKIVPHSEKSNIAAFLEQVYNHIVELEQDVEQLRATLAEHDVRRLELETCPEGAPNLHLSSVMVKEGGYPMIQEKVEVNSVLPARISVEQHQNPR